MKQYKLLCLMLCALFCLSGLWQGVCAQDDVADYVLMVDVSGDGRNIYIEGVQQSLDSFYVSATRHGRLTTLNFARSVASVGTSHDDDFYRYCDLGRMLRTLHALLAQAHSSHARVFILSDFHNAVPSVGGIPLDAAALTDVSRGFDTLADSTDLQVFLLVIPPSTRYEGYSLDAVRSVIGAERCQVVTASPYGETTQMMLDCVAETNRLLGIIDGPRPKGSLPATIAVLAIMASGIALLCIGSRYRWRQS